MLKFLKQYFFSRINYQYLCKEVRSKIGPYACGNFYFGQNWILWGLSSYHSMVCTYLVFGTSDRTFIQIHSSRRLCQPRPSPRVHMHPHPQNTEVLESKPFLLKDLLLFFCIPQPDFWTFHRHFFLFVSYCADV